MKILEQTKDVIFQITKLAGQECSDVEYFSESVIIILDVLVLC